MGANSLDVFISSLDEKLEVGVAPQLSKFFTFKKSLRPKNLDYKFLAFIPLRDTIPGQKICQISPLHEGELNKSKEDCVPDRF